jgi:hypothetical protein
MTNTAAPALAPVDALQRLAPNSIRKPPVDKVYTASLWLVTGLCILVPVLYVALIAAIGWLTLHSWTWTSPCPTVSSRTRVRCAPSTPPASPTTRPTASSPSACWQCSRGG